MAFFVGLMRVPERVRVVGNVWVAGDTMWTRTVTPKKVSIGVLYLTGQLNILAQLCRTLCGH